MMAPSKKNISDPAFKYVAPSDLRFDPSNPRFAGVSARYSQDQIQDALEKEPHYAVQLVDSFLENGFIDYEPLVVRHEGRHYVVVEGNRRLAAIRHILANREKYADRSKRLADLERIPVLVFPERSGTQNEKEQRVYLGVRHLFGFRDWPAESKARYLDALIRSATDLERVTRELNITRHDIQRYLVPYRLRKEAKTLWHPHREQEFWVLGEGLSRAGIKAYIELEVDRRSMQVKSFKRKKLANLLRFVYGSPKKNRADRLIKDTRELSSLAKLLQNKRAAVALERGRSLAEAAVFVESVDETRTRLKGLLKECGIVVGRFRGLEGAEELTDAWKAFVTAAKEFIRDGR